MKGKNPIVIIALVGLAIIAATGIYALLNPEPALKIHSATYGYYFQESRVGELQFASVGNRTYQFGGEFTLNITTGEVGAWCEFDNEPYILSMHHNRDMGKMVIHYNDGSYRVCEVGSDGWAVSYGHRQMLDETKDD